MFFRRTGLAALLCAALCAPASLPAADPAELRELQEEIHQAQEAMEVLMRQLQQLERRLESLRETPQPLPQDDRVSELNETWKMLTGREITVLAFSEPRDQSLTIALYDTAQQLHVLRRVGEDWLAPWSMPLEARTAPRLLLQDLNADGADELIVATDEIVIYRGFEDGWEPVWRSLESFHASPPPRVEVADFNGDDRPDLAVLNWQDDQKNEGERGDTLYLYTRTLSRKMQFGLTDVVSLRDEEGYEAAAGLVVADVVGDEAPEIIVGNDNGSLWLGLLSAGRVQFSKEWTIPGGGAIGAGMSAGDVAGDEKPEILIATTGGELFVIGFDRDARPELLARAAAGPLPYNISSANVDGDGKSEIVLSRGLLDYSGLTQKDVVAEVWRVNGESQLERLWRRETTNAPRHVTRDLNRDGRAEVIVFPASGGPPVIFEPRWQGEASGGPLARQPGLDESIPDELRPIIRDDKFRPRMPPFDLDEEEERLRDQLNQFLDKDSRRLPRAPQSLQRRPESDERLPPTGNAPGVRPAHPRLGNDEFPNLPLLQPAPGEEVDPQESRPYLGQPGAGLNFRGQSRYVQVRDPAFSPQELANALQRYGQSAAVIPEPLTPVSLLGQ